MKLEVGMYVRTRDGFLWKPKKIEIEEDNSVWFDNYYDFDVSDVKASHNIIELVNTDDFVNGYRVIEIHQNNRKEEPSTMVYCEFGNGFIGFYNEDIKSITTKEQFENVSYKVGEKNDR